MTYRILAPDEWNRLIPVFEIYGKEPPPKEAALAAVAEDAGEIVGVLILQLAFHLEPLIVLNPHASFLRLKETIEEGLSESKGLQYYCFSADEKINRMAEIAGMEKEPFVAIWRGEVGNALHRTGVTSNR